MQDGNHRSVFINKYAVIICNAFRIGTESGVVDILILTKRVVKVPL